MAAKVFDSALSPKIKLPKEYQDLEGIPESSVADKILKNAVKSKTLAMAYLHMYVKSAKTLGCLSKACDGE